MILHPAILLLPLFCLSTITPTATGHWPSQVTGTNIPYTATDAPSPIRDAAGNYLTVVYLENLGFPKLGRNSHAEDVAWLLSQGYRVIELDYARHAGAISPTINKDIVAINDSLASGSFGGYRDCSRYRSYVLFEGYRLRRDLPYYKDDPTVYNTPAEYTEGDTLYMDVIYPANAPVAVPIILSFSYANSHATYDSEKKHFTAGNKHQRLNLGYTLAGFNDSFLEGAPAQGFAWAIADHPKYCPWGKGKPVDGPNDAYKSYQTNPDAARKVKSAVRTLRAIGTELGLSGRIGIFGFSRGADAGSMAIGDRMVDSLENVGFHIGISDDVQAAALGPGVFDFTQIYNVPGDGDGNLETRCPWVWGPLGENYDLWQSMGAAHLVQSAATAPVLFFYNTDDQPYYQDQITHFKAKLDTLGIPTATLVDYGSGHSLPQTPAALTRLYDFFRAYLVPPVFEKGKK